MALKKEKSVFGGQVSGEYWKIIEIHINIIDSCMVVDLALYKNKDSAVSGLPLLAQKHLIIEIDSSDLLEDLRAMAYNKVKQLNDPDLSEAEDA